jgi:MoaA/NifB/PqqE/SkfB family radical SAM enzyme
MDDLKKVYVEPTSRCNLRCLTCVRRVWNEPEGDLGWPVFEALIDGLNAFPDVGTLVFAGTGEPLLHPRMADMVRLAHRKGLRTEITSNGVLLNRSLVDELAAAGLDQFTVSVDGADPKTHGDIRGGLPLSTILRNVRLFYRRHRLGSRPLVRVGIAFVAMKRNIGELPALQKIAVRAGASFILVSHFLPHRREDCGEVLYSLTATSYEKEGQPGVPLWTLPPIDWNESTEKPLARLMRGRPNIRFLDIDLNLRNNHCPFVQGGSVAVGWQGTIHPCPPLLHSYPCYVMGREKKSQACSWGRLTERTLAEIWNQPEYAAFRDRVRRFDFPPCTDCNCHLVETNQEDCCGNPFPVCGDCLWARGILRCP